LISGVVQALLLYYYVDMNKIEAVRILEKYRQEFMRAYIFGSVARGEEDPESDLDAIVVRETSLPFPERGEELLDLLKELGGADLLIYTPGEFERQRKKGGFVAYVLEEAVAVEGEQKRSSEVVETGPE
jgi:predicted nucleotidyltransferase